MAATLLTTCLLLITTLMLAPRIESLVSGGFYADNGVDQTMLYPQISKREKRKMQEEILSLLGLNHRPKPPTHETDTSAPQYMLDLYNNIIDRDTGEVRNPNTVSHLNDAWDDDRNLQSIHDADIIMSFVNHADNGKEIRLRHERDRRFWFDLNEVPVGEMLLGAELRIYKENVAKREENCNFTLSLYEIGPESDFGAEERSLVDSLNVTADYVGWIHLNISGPASKWIIFPESNFGLHLRITANGHEVRPRELRLVGVRGRQEHQSFMVAFFKSSQDVHIRHERATKQSQRTDITFNDHDKPWKLSETFDNARVQKRSCQKWTLYVSFEELGWQDWIIAPDGYAAFYCAGECSFPLNTHMNATNHAIVQTLVHLMNPRQVPKPCCAPTKLSEISVLYFDDHSNVILKKYRNMVVKSCGCH